MSYHVETKTGPKRWERCKYVAPCRTMEQAIEVATSLDQDGSLINVRIVLPDGSISKPKTAWNWF